MFSSEKNKKGYLVRFPKGLVENFKKSFPSARWDKCSIAWQIGPRSIKRFHQWSEAAKDVAKALTELDQVEFDEEELQALHAEMKTYEDMLNIKIEQLRAANCRRGKLSEIKNSIKSIKNKLENAGKDVNEAKAIAQQHQDDCKQALTKTGINIDEIIEARNIMALAMRRRDRRNFDKGMAVIDRLCEVLENSGLWSPGLLELSDMTFNRPDRDCPDDVSVDDIIDIREK